MELPPTNSSATQQTALPPLGTVRTWSAEYVLNTPSRRDGVSDKAERVERLRGCEFARAVVRNLYSDKEAGGICSKVQVLSCYYMQLFYMVRSLRQEDTRVVAVASAFLACKVCDASRRIRDLLRSHNAVRVKGGHPELDEEEQQSLRERVLKVELMLLRILRFDVEVTVVPWEELEAMADRLLVELATSPKFCEACGNRQPREEASSLKQKLVHVAKNFMNDAYMGFAPMRVHPRAIAAGALAVSVRFVRREMCPKELIRLLEQVDDALEKQSVEIATDEIFNVYRTKNGLHGGASGAGAKRPASSSTPAAAPPAAGDDGDAAGRRIKRQRVGGAAGEAGVSANPSIAE